MAGWWTMTPRQATYLFNGMNLNSIVYFFGMVWWQTSFHHGVEVPVSFVLIHGRDQQINVVSFFLPTGYGWIQCSHENDERIMSSLLRVPSQELAMGIHDKYPTLAICKSFSWSQPPVSYELLKVCRIHCMYMLYMCIYKYTVIYLYIYGDIYI